MTYSEELAQRVRELLPTRHVEEKKMMGGLTFMVNGKMCVGIVKSDLMARLDPKIYETALTKKGCRPMDFTGRTMKGFIFVDRSALSSEKELKEWIDLALSFNKHAKASKKKRPK